MQGRTGAPSELHDVKSTKEYVARVATAIEGFPPKNLGNDSALQLTAYFLQMHSAKPGTILLSAATSVSLFAATGQGPPSMKLFS
jgi:hypothetical protein